MYASMTSFTSSMRWSAVLPSRAIAYIGITSGCAGNTGGCGIHTDIIAVSSVYALFSAVNRMLNDQTEEGCLYILYRSLCL